MSELDELYQEIVMDHNRKPRNFRRLDGANHMADGFNPFCGDEVKLFLIIENETVKDVSFQGSGCAISRASVSMMTDAIKGKTVEETEHLFDLFQGLLTSAEEETIDTSSLGDLEVIAGVSEFPTRVKCATLSWHTLRGAIRGEERISTE